MIHILIHLLSSVLPWPARRRLLSAVFGYSIDPTARIGVSFVAPDSLRMGPGARIGHLNVIRGMANLDLGVEARITNLNWIYAIRAGSPQLAHEPGRVPDLTLEPHASLTSRHVIDCSAEVRLERFSLVAGVRTQFMTHAVDIAEARFHTRPITVGAYSMVGTGCVVVGGATLPAYSMLGAGSTLRSKETEMHTLYSGVPASAVRSLDPNAAFFSRDSGAF